MMRYLRFPFLLNASFIAVGAFVVVGHATVSHIHPTPQTIVEAHTVTDTAVSTRTVERKVKGRVVRIHDKVYIHVPVIVVHTDHHVIKVPAHNLPIRSAQATVATPLVTVHVPIPTTVYVPTVTTVTDTVTSTDTVTLPAVTITVTLPLDLPSAVGAGGYSGGTGQPAPTSDHDPTTGGD